jgi:RNA polymerase sigma-70 factor, ECF subfamily
MARSRPYSAILPVPLKPTEAAAARQVDARALLERLFAEYQTPILNYLYRLVGDPALAEDLTQEAFTRAWRSRASLLNVDNPRAWLYRIATNAARDHARRGRLLAWLPLSSADSVLAHNGPEEAGSEHDAMRQALLKLTPDYRIPLVLFTCQEFSLAEIAVALGISPDAVKQRLVRARQQLREAYQ